MKNLLLSKMLKTISFLVLTLTVNANANWLKTGQRGSDVLDLSNETKIQNSEKKDSLPEGVTQGWLNSLTDENGNNIVSETNTERSVLMPEDPEGDALQRKIFNGFDAGSYYGYSASEAGDMNGDGYGDIIVGAYNYNSSTGRAYIYYGGLHMNTVPDVILTGETTFDWFGQSVSGAGDVNGDGFADVIVGAPGSTAFGRSYIYFGGVGMNNSADVIITGETSGSNFGLIVSSTGDVNGDGYSDVIVGASAYNGSTGRAYIFLGGASMNNTADVTMTGEAINNAFGQSLSGAGDMNGDGYADVIISAYNFGTSMGKTYIFLGGEVMDNTPDVTMLGEANNHFFGGSVSGAGDVNGDGYSDVIVGARGYSSNLGRTYIFFGDPVLNNIADVSINGEVTNSYFGSSVSDAGDVNGDGYSDVIIGASTYGSSAGRSYILFGGADMNNVFDVIMTGEISGNNFGISVSSAGDVNGDGYSDVISGASGVSANTGRVYLYDYFMKNEIIQDLTVTGEATNNFFGGKVSSAGDVNGDGFSDVIVGANGYSSFTGRAYIYFGGASMDNIADVTMTGITAGDRLGISVSSAGDVNADGYSDVIVGAWGYSSFTGRAYIYFGGASMNNIADVSMTGETTSNNFGGAVSSAGDVNGDGYADAIVGANGYSSSTGRAYIFFGGSLMNNVSDVTMTGEAINNGFGQSVSSAGDVNRDGYSDVIVGADGYSANKGRAYIYFGGTSMNTTADVTLNGEATSDQFGRSVSLAGDINADGYSDVIVGAHAYSAFLGRTYIYFGGASMNNIADVTLTGESQSSFGSSVASGDVNGDGYSDVVVGAPGYSTNTGRGYIYFGGIPMDNIADVTMTGEAIANGFGGSVSSSGDLNGDGYSDVIVGADIYSTNTGRSYIFNGSAISAKPILIYVRDVPQDQGGKVNLKWARSSFDVNGNSIITDYLVQRSFPPTGGNFSWQNITVIPASHESFYTYVDFTPNDSSANNNSAFFYRVTARTPDINVFWRSGILSGRSIDNISPPMVSPFTASPFGSDVITNWKRSSASDLLNYILFRSTAMSIDPYTETPFATTTDSTYLDTSPLSGVYYYFIVAQDIHGNYSPVAVAESPNITVNLTMFIEGFYNAGSNTQVSDTITAFLRNTVSPFNIVSDAEAEMSTTGNVELKFGNAPGGTYYLVITHRNSIETWSASGISVTTGGSVSYDLSSASSQAFGNNMIQIDALPLRFAIYSGDVNQDDVVDGSDTQLIDNDATNFETGYLPTDINGDNFIDGTDAQIAGNNSDNFVLAIVP